MLPGLQQIDFFLELLVCESKQGALRNLWDTRGNKFSPGHKNHCKGMYFTVVMDSSFMLTLILLQGAPGKPGEIGSKGERVGWRILLVISLR